MNDLFDDIPRRVGGYEIRRLPVTADKQERVRRTWDTPQFPFSALAVGECFDQAPIHGLQLIETQNLVSGAACQYRKKQKPFSWQFTTRQMAGFVRCWRVEP